MVSEPAWAALLRTGAQPCGGNKRFFISVSELAQEPSDGGSVRGNASGSFQFSRKLWQGDFAILRYQSFPETLTDINNVAPIAEEGLCADGRRAIRQKKTLPRTAMADLKRLAFNLIHILPRRRSSNNCQE